MKPVYQMNLMKIFHLYEFHGLVEKFLKLLKVPVFILFILFLFYILFY